VEGNFAEADFRMAQDTMSSISKEQSISDKCIKHIDVRTTYQTSSRCPVYFTASQTSLFTSTAHSNPLCDLFLLRLHDDDALGVSTAPVVIG
jgi:hypothetical protein